MRVETFEILLPKFLKYIKGNKPFRVIALETGDLDLIPWSSGFERENCTIILEYMLQHKTELFSKSLSLKEFDLVRNFLDNLYLYRKQVDQKGEFENALLSLRLGGDVPAEWIKANKEFKKFIKSNYLHHRLFVLRLPLLFDEKRGAALPLQEEDHIEWVYWDEIKKEGSDFYFEGRLIFKADERYRLIPEYTCLHRGICHYNVGIDPKWEPFQVADPTEWNHKYVLEVWTVSLPMLKPPMFQRTHAYIVLKDSEGNIRSVGQDVLVDRANFRVTEILNRKPGFGKITTPDIYTFYPTNARRFWNISIEITKEEHDRIIAIVEKDKANKQHSMSVLKGNCVSYVLKILREGVGIQVDASMHSLHIMLKEFLPHSWYRALFKNFNRWYGKQSPVVKKALFFLPIVYIPSLLLGIVALFTRQNNYQEIRDFSFLDLIFRPWKLSCEHPLALHRKLEAIQSLVPTLRKLYKNI